MSDMDLVFDMETGDPDDFLTLALLAGRPSVNLKAVTVTPGTPHQVGLVRWGLKKLGKPEIPVGAFNLDHKKGLEAPTCVSQWHWDTFGNIDPSTDALPGWEVLDKALGPSTILVTGAPLKNLGRLIERMGVRLYDRTPDLGTLVIQGGFAGDNIVPAEHRLPKFAGRQTCPTYNLNGDPRAAEAVFQHAHWWSGGIWMVSKNVCHGVVYEADLHERLKAHPEPSEGLSLVIQAMTGYLQRHPSGKAFHDPLAAMCALDRGIGTWVEVEPYRERGEWGSRPKEGTGIRIITSYDRERFIKALVSP